MPEWHLKSLKRRQIYCTLLVYLPSFIIYKSRFIAVQLKALKQYVVRGFKKKP